MPPRLVSDVQLVERLTGLFRERGFDAASLDDIEAATGLKRSSLYHRFPGGKQQMAAEVVGQVRDELVGRVLAPLNETGSPRARITKVGARLVEFYEGGSKNCLLDVLSLGGAGDDATGRLRDSAAGWIDAFTSIARESGARTADARARAQDALASIEGGLVLARVTGDPGAFTRAIRRLPDVLGAAAG